jgi:hypothetical protein
MGEHVVATSPARFFLLLLWNQPGHPCTAAQVACHLCVASGTRQQFVNLTSSSLELLANSSVHNIFSPRGLVHAAHRCPLAVHRSHVASLAYVNQSAVAKERVNNR